jgi:hypothetical protein
VDAGAQARKLVNAIKWIGEGRNCRFRPLSFAGRSLIFSGINAVR